MKARADCISTAKGCLFAGAFRQPGSVCDIRPSTDIAPIPRETSIIADIGDAPCYLTFDIDCLDPAFAPGTGTPIPGGLSTLQVLEIIRALGELVKRNRLNIVGLDIVEVAPCYDHAQMTSLAAAQVAQELLCMLAARNTG